MVLLVFSGHQHANRIERDHKGVGRQVQQVRGLKIVHVISIEADGLGGERSVIHHPEAVGFDHLSQHLLLGVVEMKALLSRLRRQSDGRSEGCGHGVGRQSSKVCQIVDMLSHLRVLGVQRQGLGELGPGHLRLAHKPGLICILDQLGDAVLACNLQIEGVVGVRRICLRRLGESLLRGVHVTLFHGAHAQHVILFRRPRLCVPCKGNKRTPNCKQAD